MKVFILTVSVLALAIMNCKQEGVAPDTACNVATPRKAQQAEQTKAGKLEFIIKPLGFNPFIPYSAPYVSYSGSKGTNEGC